MLKFSILVMSEGEKRFQKGRNNFGFNCYVSTRNKRKNKKIRRKLKRKRRRKKKIKKKMRKNKKKKSFSKASTF